MNVGILSGGTQVNIVPNYTRLNTDLRVSDLKQIDSVIETLKKLIKDLENEYNCKISLERKLFIPPLSNTNNSFINSYAKENGLIIEKAKYGTEAGYYQMIGSEVLIFGAGDIALAHNKEENVPIPNLMKYQNYFINLMNKFRKELNI